MDRTHVLAVAVALLVTLGGCAALTGGDLTYSASKATVAPQAVSAANYQEVSVQDQTVNRTVSVAGQDRTVRLTNWVATYRTQFSSTNSPAPGTVVVLSTPQVSVAGQELNPVGNMPPDQLITTLLQRYGGVSDVTRVDAQQMTVLGESTEVSTFRTTMDFQGRTVPVLVHLATVKHQGDYVVVVGVHPTVVSPSKAGIQTMFTGVQHGD